MPFICPMERFHSRDQYLCKFIGTKESVYIKNCSTPTGLFWDTNMAAVSLDCEKSLFFLRFSESNARARKRRSRETHETRAAAREEKRETARFFVPLPSRAISHARRHLRVSRFARRTTEKRETARSLPFHCFGIPIRKPWRHVKTLYI